MAISVRTRKKRAMAGEIPTASFSDIAFLLIIFFILTTTLQKQLGFLTDLPSGEKSQQLAQKTATVNLNNEKILFNSEPVDLPKLTGKLKELNLFARTGDDKIVMLEASGRVPYQNYYDVMATISKAGGVIAIVREEGGRK